MDKKIKYIFSINPGRCGSKYISTLLNLNDKIVSVHEEPPLFDEVMRDGQKNSNILRKFLKDEKIPSIINLLKKNKSNIYLETSHLFGCGFFYHLLDMQIIPDILIIERDPVQVSESLFSLNTIPGRTEKGLKYLIYPEDPDVILKNTEWNTFSDFELCYWYVLEMIERSKLYESIILKNGGSVFKTSIQHIQNISNFDTLCKNIVIDGLFNKRDYYKIVKKKINQKQNKKKRLLSDIEINNSVYKINRIIKK